MKLTVQYGFYHLQGGKLKSWQYLHITIAIISFICSVIVFVFLPDSPTKAKWASEQDKKLLVERVRSNNQGLKQKHFKKEQMIEALTDPFTLCLFLLCVFITLVVGGVGAFGGLLVTKAFGFSVSCPSRV
jgi:sugar phosphate permease